jgi:hypothetical protein
MNYLMKLPDTLLHTLVLSASSLLLPASPADSAVASTVSSESGKVVIAAEIQAASDATPTPEPVGLCTACGRG